MHGRCYFGTNGAHSDKDFEGTGVLVVDRLVASSDD